MTSTETELRLARLENQVGMLTELAMVMTTTEAARRFHDLWADSAADIRRLFPGSQVAE